MTITIGSLIWIVIGLLLIVSITLSIIQNYKELKFSQNKNLIMQAVIAAEIRKKIHQNYYSSSYCPEYDRSLKRLLKTLEENNGAKS